MGGSRQDLGEIILKPIHASPSKRSRFNAKAKPKPRSPPKPTVKPASPTVRPRTIIDVGTPEPLHALYKNKTGATSFSDVTIRIHTPGRGYQDISLPEYIVTADRRARAAFELGVRVTALEQNIAELKRKAEARDLEIKRLREELYSSQCREMYEYSARRDDRCRICIKMGDKYGPVLYPGETEGEGSRGVRMRDVQGNGGGCGWTLPAERDLAPTSKFDNDALLRLYDSSSSDTRLEPSCALSEIDSPLDQEDEETDPADLFLDLTSYDSDDGGDFARAPFRHPSAAVERFEQQYHLDQSSRPALLSTSDTSKDTPGPGSNSDNYQLYPPTPTSLFSAGFHPLDYDIPSPSSTLDTITNDRGQTEDTGFDDMLPSSPYSLSSTVEREYVEGLLLSLAPSPTSLSSWMDHEASDTGTITCHDDHPPLSPIHTSAGTCTGLLGFTGWARSVLQVLSDEAIASKDMASKMEHLEWTWSMIRTISNSGYNSSLTGLEDWIHSVMGAEVDELELQRLESTWDLIQRHQECISEVGGGRGEDVA